MRPTVFLFDLGGVLVDNAGFERLGALLPIAMSDEELKSRWLSSAAVRSFELGRCSPQAFAEAFEEEWGLRLGWSEFLEAFKSWPKGLYPGAAELLQRLSRRHVVACLSNSNAAALRRLSRAFSDSVVIPLAWMRQTRCCVLRGGAAPLPRRTIGGRVFR